EEDEGAEDDFWPSEAKFHTPCSFLINSTCGCCNVSESTWTDLCSSGISCTEILNSPVWTNGWLLLNPGSSAIERLATRKRGGNNPKLILPSWTLRFNCPSSLV